MVPHEWNDRIRSAIHLFHELNNRRKVCGARETFITYYYHYLLFIIIGLPLPSSLTMVY